MKDHKAIIIFGPPGSGKSTQAEFIKKAIANTVHFNSGEEFRKFLSNPKNLKNKKVAAIKKDYNAGRIVDPLWTLDNLVGPATIKFAKQGKNVVYSGSFRSLLETIGTKKHIGLAEITEKAFGKENIIAVFVYIPIKESVKRNLLRHRSTEDTEKMIRFRCKAFKQVTYPAISALKKRGIKVVKIDGRPKREVVFKDIKKELKKFGIKLNRN